MIASAIALSGRVPGTEYGSQYIYQNANGSNVHDVTQGNNCTATITTHCTAAAGFDQPSGMGSFTGLGLFGGFHGGASVGDFNDDGKVNITDMSIMLTHYATTGDTVAQGDLSGDGKVTILDLSIFISDWTGN
jgi:hypothetical protein